MTKTTKYALIAGIVVLSIAALPFVVVLPFAASNAVAALYIAVFDRRPTDAELVGKFVYNAEWGTAILELHPDHSFSEEIAPKTQQASLVTGRWSSESGDEGFSAEVSLKPFIGVNDFSRGTRFDVAGLNFYRQRFGSVYGEIDPDTGERFLKQ
ncbi:MAG: hypothetical protein M3O02_02690 [Acidobacteriota bacterium]|nr:hypothetical protein [Acidobacteriota bacterium]